VIWESRCKLPQLIAKIYLNNLERRQGGIRASPHSGDGAYPIGQVLKLELLANEIALCREVRLGGRPLGLLERHSVTIEAIADKRLRHLPGRQWDSSLKQQVVDESEVRLVEFELGPVAFASGRGDGSHSGIGLGGSARKLYYAGLIERTERPIG
jgi:hypothetical protein